MRVKFTKKVTSRGFTCEGLKESRKAKKLTVRKMAKLCKISPSYLSEIESGKKSMSPKTMKKIESAMAQMR